MSNYTHEIPHERGWNMPRKIVRDAGTGRIVKPEEAKRRPKETVTETVPTRRRSSPKKRGR